MEIICLIIPSLHIGGMERVMSELAHYLVKKEKTSVHLILYGISPEISYPLPPSLSIYKPDFKFNNNRRFWSTLKTIWFLRKKIMKLNPTAVLSFGEYWNNLILLSLIGLRFPVYVSDRCQPDKSLGKVHDLLRKILYKKAKGVILQTEKARTIYSSFLKEETIKVIGNPIRQIENKKKCIIKENIVLSVGRLIESKHHDMLIKMFVKINKEDWKLYIVGGDALKQNNMEKLRKLVRELNAEDKVVLLGKSKDVDNYYLKSKIFAFTSSSEGFPNVIGEAQSAGLPVIAFDCIAGPSEMILNNKNGYLIPPFDFTLFQKKLEILMENENLQNQFGLIGKSTIQKFNIDSIGEKYYQYILGK